MNREPTDSTGRTIRVGDRVRWRGEVFTIAGFPGREVMGIHAIEFVEPLPPGTTLPPDEMSVDLVASAGEGGG